jgi:hypothetical protein
MTAFFSPDNPLAIIAAFLIFFLIVKKLVLGSKLPKFISYPLLAIILIVVASNLSFLEIISYSFPLFMIVVIAIFMMILPFVLGGVDQKNVWNAIGHKSSAFYLKLITIVIVIFAGSMVYGQDLLEHKSILSGPQAGTGFSITDAFETKEPVKETDYSLFFTTPFLSVILLGIVILLGFLAVQKMWIFG